MDRLYFLCSLVLLFTSAQAADYKVIFSNGLNYKIPLKGEKVLLSKNLALIESDTIEVANNGFAVIKVDGHATIRLEPGSKIQIKSLPYNFENSNELESPTELKLNFGSIFVDLEQKSDSESFIVETKTATLGVRGTQFLVAQEDDLVVGVNEGLVKLQHNTSKQMDYIGAEESIVVEKGLNFTARKKYAALKNIDWKNLSRDQKRSLWKEARAEFRSEFRKKREKWKKDPKRIESLKKRWAQKKARFRERVKKFKSNPKRQERLLKIRSMKRKGRANRRAQRKNRELPLGNDFQKKKREKENRKMNEDTKQRIKRLREIRERRRRTGR